MVKKVILVDGIVLMIKGEPVTFICHLLKINPEKWGLLWNLVIIYGLTSVNQQIIKNNSLIFVNYYDKTKIIYIYRKIT